MAAASCCLRWARAAARASRSRERFSSSGGGGEGVGRLVVHCAGFLQSGLLVYPSG